LKLTIFEGSTKKGIYFSSPSSAALRDEVREERRWNEKKATKPISKPLLIR
jgi:hypothetical protein